MTDDERAVMFWTLHAIRIENRAHDHSAAGHQRDAAVLYAHARLMRKNIEDITRRQDVAA